MIFFPNCFVCGFVVFTFWFLYLLHVFDISLVGVHPVCGLLFWSWPELARRASAGFQFIHLRQLPRSKAYFIIPAENTIDTRTLYVYIVDASMHLHTSQKPQTNYKYTFDQKQPPTGLQSTQHTYLPTAQYSHTTVYITRTTAHIMHLLDVGKW